MLLQLIIILLALAGTITVAGFESAYATIINLDATDIPPTYFDDHGITFSIDTSSNTTDTTDNRIDSHYVTIYSSTDTHGCQNNLPVQETGPNTGQYTFAGYVNFTTTGGTNCAIPQLKVSDGDTVTVKSWDGTTKTATILNACFPSNSCNTSNLPTPGPQPYLGTMLDCGGAQNTDPDGLCKSWKKSYGLAIPYHDTNNSYTVTFTYNGTCSTNPDDCPHYGGKDVYVELDKLWKHGPNQIAIANVVSAFKNQGIYLHVLLDDVIQFHKDVYTPPSGGGSGGQDFDKIKSVFFGTITERTTTPNGCPTSNATSVVGKSCISAILTAKRQAFHYVLFAHKSQSTSNPSGTSELPGNDIMITLGSFTGGKGNQMEQEGTVMHELGHNLGLDHGGPYSRSDGHTNCKPNYPSAMSYTRQFTNYISNRALDYSRGTAGNMTGNLYNETIGVGAGGSSLAMVWNYGSMITKTANSQGQVDWNNDGQIVRTQAGTSYNLNAIGGSSGCGTNSLPYNNYNDWTNLIFTYSGYSSFGDGAPSQNFQKLNNQGIRLPGTVPTTVSQIENGGVSFENFTAGFTLQIQSLNSTIYNLPETSFGDRIPCSNETAYKNNATEIKSILNKEFLNATSLINQGAGFAALAQLQDVKSKVIGSSDTLSVISDIKNRTSIVMSIDNLVSGISDGYKSDYIPPKTFRETYLDPLHAIIGYVNNYISDQSGIIIAWLVIGVFIAVIVAIVIALGYMGHKYRSAKKKLREAGLDMASAGTKKVIQD